MSPENIYPEPPPLPSAAAIAGYCRACGKALDAAGVRHAQGAIYCQEHLPMDAPDATASPYARPSSHSGQPPYTSTPPPDVVNPEVSPGLAFVLGFIPGVGAIYNGQYVKGLIHVACVGLIISILNSGPGSLEPLLALMLVAFWIYMPFEAYHTARFRRLGRPVDAVSSLIYIQGRSSGKFPAGPVLLIALGILLLLDNLGLFELRRALRFWPAILIAAGIYMLYTRLTSSASSSSSSSPEANR
jgi:hypothetical protein